MELWENIKLLSSLISVMPPAIRQAVLSMLGKTEQSKYLDVRSEFYIAFLRALLQPKHPLSISRMQPLTLRDDGVKGPLWVSTYVAPAPPETSVRDVLLGAVESLAHSKPAGADGGIRVPQLVSVEAEWTGYRAGVASSVAPPTVSEREKYNLMMADAACTNPRTTVLFFHGGAFYLCDPATHRHIAAKLAKHTGGRCYSVRYRLAPQNPFPSALLDALVSYLTLLYPPPDAFHEPVKPEDVVFAGDSAGGNLSLALLQLLLEIRRQGTRIMWHGELREVPLPAGVAVNSPWLDLTESDPSWQIDHPTPFDYLPKRGPKLRAPIPPCPLWPANPPRRNMYADDALVSHPLVSIATARSWAGSPPIWMCTGWEILAGEDKFLARKLVDDGVAVRYEEYEAMPHVFVSVIPHVPSARRCFEGWATFIRDAVSGTSQALGSSAVLIKAQTLEEEPLKFAELFGLGEEQIRERIIAAANAKEEPETLAKL